MVSYRIAIFCVISYRIESCPLWLYRAITNEIVFKLVMTARHAVALHLLVLVQATEIQSTMYDTPSPPIDNI